jgi:hypothetical protein
MAAPQLPTPLTLLAAAAIALAACAERPPQRAALDDTTACPTVQAPGFANAGSIARFHSTGMLTQLKTKC